MDLFRPDEIAPEEAEDQGELLIEGDVREGPRTIFVNRLTDGFEIHCRNILAMTKCYNWEKVVEWKRMEETYESTDEELAAIVTAEGCLRQIFDLNFKVNKALSSKNFLVNIRS